MDVPHLDRFVAGTAVLLVLIVAWDVFRPDPRPPAPVGADSIAGAATAAGAAGDTTAQAPARAPGAGSAPGAVARPPDDPGYITALARAEARRQIRASAGVTYLSEIVAASSDSMLHRWVDRVHNPVRVYLAPTRAANFQPAFVDAIRDAFRRWEDARLPVRFELGADSAAADVVIRWKIQFEENRSGQTDLLWNEEGAIASGVILLATFDPAGKPVTADDVRVVALHEIGHLLGLDHSPDPADLMFPEARVRDLSLRDVRTADLLYRLAPGSVR